MQQAQQAAPRQSQLHPPRKVRLGELLVHEGILTPEQVIGALTVQKKRRPQKPFGVICQELGLLSTVELARILRKYRHRLLLGELLVHVGLITQEQLDEALKIQKRTQQKLGSILLDKGWLDEASLIKALFEQAETSQRKMGKFDGLITSQRLTPEQLVAARKEAQQEGCPIETILMEKYHIPKQEIGKSLSAYSSCPFLEYNKEILIDPELVRGINPNYLRVNYWIPLRATADTVEVLIDDPFIFHKTQDIKRLFPGKEIRYWIGLREDIQKYVNSVSAGGRHDAVSASDDEVDPIASILDQLATEERDELTEETDNIIDENDSAIVRLVNQIIMEAVKMGASDIHIEPNGDKRDTVVRFRIDGHCHEYLKVQPSHRRALVSRLKVMAHLDIAEKRKPQDGKITFRMPDKEIELRVATIPSAGPGNEDAVLRILAASEPISLDKMRMTERNFREFTSILQKPYGMILCVGPTGSGKTTTLHSALGYINTPSRKIWTAEDPVEITQVGLRQVQVQPKIGFTFAAALRSFLRADPDVIMVGEIRDHETAEIAINASLTGHLVLSTLHTNSAVETVTRLLDMGMDPFNFADALLGIVAQRLARTICSQCKEMYHPAKQEYDALAHGYGEKAFALLQVPYNDKFMLARGKGCEACRQSGYKGRVALHELLIGTSEFKALLYARAPVMELHKLAVSQGMTSLLQDGVLKCLQGLTDYNQVRAVAMQ
ncbi:MAG TPA: ATPase, T2SS/T4P/T4SS family [Methylomirabilota bacterium]|nr:ATPase, T2SS/T4P/T4SS family [Methylomirabilota bacterium]